LCPFTRRSDRLEHDPKKVADFLEKIMRQNNKMETMSDVS